MTMVPVSPTAAKSVPLKATPRRLWVVGEAAACHVLLPSWRVMRLPPLPAATKRPSPYTTPRCVWLEADADGVQVTLSGEVSTVPRSPTATKRPPSWSPYPTCQRKSPVLLTRGVQVMPSGEVRIAPYWPVTMNWPRAKVPPQSALSVPLCTVVQLRPSADRSRVPPVPPAINTPLP